MYLLAAYWSRGVLVVISESLLANGSWEGHKRVGVVCRGGGSLPEAVRRGGRAMLGTMMYPTEESLQDMRVPPIQLEHLPEVFLCT